MDSAKPNTVTSDIRPLPSLSSDSLRTRLAAIDFEMDDISAELDQLYARIKQLRARRKPIATVLDAIVYPILTLPVEITAEILKFHVYSLTGGGQYHSCFVVDLDFATRAGPLFLAQVCSAWRNIVMSTPTMWCSVRMFSRKSETKVSDWRKLLKCWLNRAADKPLYLDFAPGSNSGPTQTQLLLPTVLAFSPRWRALHVVLNSSDFFAIERIQGRIPHLQELKLQGDSEFPLVPIAGFSVAPALRKVELIDALSTRVTLPWGQLTVLVLRRQTVVDCLDILHQTPLLEELSVNIVASKPYEELPSMSTTLNHVRTFRFMDAPVSKPPTANLCSYLSLPCLITLDYQSDSAATTVPITFLESSQCGVQSLSVPNLLIADMMTRYVGSVRDLTFSVLDLSSNSKGLSNSKIPSDLEALSAFFLQIANDSMFLPHLRSLQIPDCRPLIPYAEVAQMLTSRWYDRGSEQKLESFQLTRSGIGLGGFTQDGYSSTPPDVMTAAIAATLRALENDGLRIQIRSWNGTKCAVQSLSVPNLAFTRIMALLAKILSNNAIDVLAYPHYHPGPSTGIIDLSKVRSLQEAHRTVQAMLRHEVKKYIAAPPGRNQLVLVVDALSFGRRPPTGLPDIYIFVCSVFIL
ncbi:F-box domain-containing protein [Favolaschia claudopus]|uniref:F-box domain-containing protein n=1 Tax=Favolaschia claudopus TaxID=2862362 RepID=A0AAW0BII0_9AGAR